MKKIFRMNLEKSRSQIISYFATRCMKYIKSTFELFKCRRNSQPQRVFLNLKIQVNASNLSFFFFYLTSNNGFM